MMLVYKMQVRLGEALMQKPVQNYIALPLGFWTAVFHVFTPITLSLTQVNTEASGCELPL